jgi:hypothetical protein
MPYQWDGNVGQKALLWICLVCAASATIAAVLNPYSLPSQQQIAPVPETRVQEQSTTRPAIGDSYYRRFAEGVKALKREERADLLRTFSQKRDLALQTGRMEEAQHYGRLVQILDANK